MVGGRDFTESHFNRAMQAHRQPGSAFKPFVYAAALEEGYSPASIISNLDETIATPQGAWTPEDEHSSATSMTLRTGLRTSSNRAAVRLLQEVGIGRTVRYAKSLGVGDVPAVPSLALGSGEVTLQSMTAAYAAFANHGFVPKPVLIRRVEDHDGRVLFDARDSSTRAVSDVTAFLMSTMMADVINAGTGARARSLGFTLPAAGKTGTTNEFHDAWFIGFTPKIVTGVWVGFDQPRTILPNGFAADVAVPLWANFMKVATRGDKREWLTPPPGVTTATVCRVSGRLATDDCRDVAAEDSDGFLTRRSMAYTEYFARGTAPTQYCDQHNSAGFFTKVASAIGIDSRPMSPNIEAIAMHPPPAAPVYTPTAPPKVEAPPPAPQKRRGFWSRLFGRGKAEDRKTESSKKPRE
jgi:penicillin-binding protein 1A